MRWPSTNKSYNETKTFLKMWSETLAAERGALTPAISSPLISMRWKSASTIPPPSPSRFVATLSSARRFLGNNHDVSDWSEAAERVWSNAGSFNSAALRLLVDVCLTQNDHGYSNQEKSGIQNIKNAFSRRVWQPVSGLNFYEAPHHTIFKLKT